MKEAVVSKKVLLRHLKELPERVPVDEVIDLIMGLSEHAPNPERPTKQKDALNATSYLLSTPANRRRLMWSIRQLRGGGWQGRGEQ